MAKDRTKEILGSTKPTLTPKYPKLTPKFPNRGELGEVGWAPPVKQEGGASRPTSACRGLGRARPARAPCAPPNPRPLHSPRSPIGGAGKEAEEGREPGSTSRQRPGRLF